MNDEFDIENVLKSLSDLYETACADQKAAKTVRQLKSQLGSYINHLEDIRKFSGSKK
tara:strand:- start:78 stop:248 length:171 start_codon:yes stop_codon:yes gene_type:complete